MTEAGHPPAYPARAGASRRVAELVRCHRRRDLAGMRVVLAELLGRDDVLALADAFARTVDVLLAVQLGDDQVDAYLAGNIRRLTAHEGTEPDNWSFSRGTTGGER